MHNHALLRGLGPQKKFWKIKFLSRILAGFQVLIHHEIPFIYLQSEMQHEHLRDRTTARALVGGAGLIDYRGVVL